MAKSRTKKVAKADAEAAVASMFDEGGEVLAKAAERLADEQREDRLAADLAGEQPPPRDPGGSERAWESYPLIDLACLTCGGRQRYLGEGRASCRRGHEVSGATVLAASVNADAEPGIRNGAAKVVRPNVVEVTGRKTGTGARVAFHELPTTRLEQIDYDLADEVRSQVDVDGAFVKVSAALRPSEREGFDGRALKEDLAARGARAVLLAVHPVAEAPDREAKAEVAQATRPEAAIAAWFDGLPVPEDERAAAKERALEILAKEEG